MLAIAWIAYAGAYLAMGWMPGADWALWLTFVGYGVITAALEGTEKALVAGYHFWFPSVGHIEKAGSGYRLIPAPWNPVL